MTKANSGANLRTSKPPSAFELTSEQANAGDPSAQVALGDLYWKGEGVKQDVSEAARWFRHAAKQGNKRAQFSLGLYYEKEVGDFQAATLWYRKAAEQNLPEAQNNLGVMYATGKGVDENLDEAIKWFQMAARQGDACSKKNLAQAVEKKIYLSLMSKGRSAGGYHEGLDATAILADQRENASTLGPPNSPPLILQYQRTFDNPRAAGEPLNEGGSAPEAGPRPSSPTPEVRERLASSGTGFLVSDDGYLITCEHVVRGAASFRVRASRVFSASHQGGYLQAKLPEREIIGTLPARLIKKNRALDLALLKVSGSFQPLPVESEPHIKLGDAVFTIGFPNPGVQGIEPKLTRGEISSMAGIQDNPCYFQISVPVQPGNSGGALVDENGNVVGVVTARLDDVATYETSGALPQNVNYAVKGSFLRDFLEKVPELFGKLKPPRTTRNREAASTVAERAAVLVIAE